MGTRTFAPTTSSPRNTSHEKDEAEPRHAFPKAAHDAAFEHVLKRIAQAPTSTATLAHQSSNAETIKAALAMLELYANAIDDNAKYIGKGSASTGPGPLENTLLDNVNAVRDQTDHVAAYLRGIGVSPATLHQNGKETLERVESALSRVEKALGSAPKRDKRFKTDANPATVKTAIDDLRATLGLNSGKTVTALPDAKVLRKTSLENNIRAATATINSVFAGNTGDITRLAQQLREVAVEEPGVQLEHFDEYPKSTKPRLDRLVERLNALEAAVPAMKKNDEYADARAKLDREMARGAYGR